MKRDYVVESKFEYLGYTCVVIYTTMGHRCGYVGIPKSHSLYGKDYDDIYEFIDCHWGLTYSGGGNNFTYPIKEENNLWWFGWDYAHCDDSNDWSCYKEYFGEEPSEYLVFSYNGGNIYYKEDVERECKKVAEQLKERE